MGGFSRVAAGGLLSVLAACRTPPPMDLAENEALYRPTGYHASVAVDRPVFVTPVADARQPITEASSTPVVLVDDGRWHRPPPVMLDELLGRELRDAKVFTAVLERAEPAALILKPELVTWRGGIAEEIAGRSSFGEVALRLVVLGPAGTDGARRAIFDETFRHLQAGTTEMLPRNPMQLIGMATCKVLGKALAALDQANVARSSVPLDR